VQTACLRAGRAGVPAGESRRGHRDAVSHEQERQLKAWLQCRSTLCLPRRSSHDLRIMMTALQATLDLLDLEEIERNLFRGHSPRSDWQRVFGGQVIGQA